MNFKNILIDNMFNISIDLKNMEWLEYDFTIDKKNDELFKFFKLIEVYLIEKSLKSEINLDKKSSALALKLPDAFYLSNCDKKELTKLNNKIKNSSYLKEIIELYKLKGKDECFIKEKTKLIITNKSIEIQNNLKNIYKMYMFNYIYVSVIYEMLKNRENKYKLNSLIKPNFNLSKHFYSCYEYYVNFGKGDLKWINKMFSYFDIFDKEIKTISILTYSLINDIFENDNYNLTFNTYKEKLINLILTLSKNIKEAKMKRPLVINNVNEEIDFLNIKSCNFNNLIFYYDRLEKTNLNLLTEEFKNNISFINFETFVKFGNIKLNILTPEITNNHLNLNIISQKNKE